MNAAFIQIHDGGFLGMGHDVFGPIKVESAPEVLRMFRRAAANLGRYHARFFVLTELEPGTRVFPVAEFCPKSPSWRADVAPHCITSE